MMRTWIGRAAALGMALLTVFLVIPSAAAADGEKVRRPRIGLVLSGGGALGFAHIGVIKVLQENNVPVDIVTGTSMGAIVGAAYASGASVSDMQGMATSTDWDALFSEAIPRKELPLRFKPGRNRELFGNAKIGIGDKGIVVPTGFIEGQNVLPLFQRLYGNAPSPVDFDKLPLPFRAVTADIETGEAVVPSYADLATIVRASMSVPGFFSPVQFQNHLLVDGGIVNNFPIDIAQSMGADVIIAVDLAGKFKKKDELTDPLEIGGQILSFLLQQNSTLQKARLRPHDIYILADTTEYTPTSFGDGPKIMEKGEEAAREVLGRLKGLSVPGDEYTAWNSKRTAPLVSKNETIAAISVDNDSPIGNTAILSAVDLKQGDAFDRLKVEENLGHLYNMGYFSTVEYSTEDSPGGKLVTIHVRKKDWLDRYVRVGASLEDDFNGDSTYRLGIDYRATDLGKSGRYLDLQGEIGRTPYLSGEWYEPMTEDSPWFLAPRLYIGQAPVSVRDSNNDLIAEYLGTRGWGALSIGRELGRSGEIATILRRGRGRLERHIGDPVLPSLSYDIGEVSTIFTYDSLDTPDFPTEGLLTRLLYLNSGETLGADSQYNELTGRAAKPFTFGNNTLLALCDFSQTSPRRPVTRSFSFGGFLDISGYQRASLSASDYEIVRLVYYHRFSEYKLPISNLNFFLGSSVEYASLRSDVEVLVDRNPIWGGSVFIGIDTPLIPTYIGVGLAEEGNIAVYLTLGRLSAPE